MENQDNKNLSDKEIKVERARKAREAKKNKAELIKKKNDIIKDEDIDNIEPISYNEFMSIQNKIDEIKKINILKEVPKEIPKEILKDTSIIEQKKIKEKKVIKYESSDESEDEEIQLLKLKKKKEKIENKLTSLNSSKIIQDIPKQETIKNITYAPTQQPIKKTRKDLLLEQLKMGYY